MSSITIRATAQCSGGNHITISVTGEFSTTFVMDVANLADLDSADARKFVEYLIFFGKRGRTLAQLRTALQSGVTVTL